MTDQNLYANPRGVAVIGDPGRASFEIPEGLPPCELWPPDIAASEYAIEEMKIRAASVRGVQHRYSPGAAPRQDSYGIGANADNGILVAMVCDGVGSLDYSHEAANHVCQSLPWRIVAGEDWQTAVADVNEELMELDRSKTTTRLGNNATMATTMVAATIRRESQTYGIHLSWIGDSEAWNLDDKGVWTKLAPAEVNNSDTGITTGRTKALPADAPVVNEFDFTMMSGTIFLMSDGVGTPLAMNTEVQTTLANWWKNPPDPFTFARQVAFARKSFVDDRTVIGIWLEPMNGGEPEQATDGEERQTTDLEESDIQHD